MQRAIAAPFTIARATQRRPIPRIRFNAQHVIPGLTRCDIQEQARHANARHGFLARGFNGFANGSGQRCGLDSCSSRARCIPGGGEGEEGFERRHPAPRSASEVNVIRPDRGKHDAALLRTCDQHIQPAFAAIGGKRAEAHGKLTISAAPITDRNHNRIAFIPLHVFQVLHEERFIRMRGEEGFRIRVVASRGFNGIQDRITLTDGKRRDTQGIAGCLPRMRHHRFRHRARFFRIGAGAARVKPPFNTPQ